MMMKVKARKNFLQRLLLSVVLFIFLCSLLVVSIKSSSPTHAQLEGLLYSEIVVDDLSQPKDFEFTNDGRILIATLDGKVLVHKNGQILPTPFIQLPVNNAIERGLENFALDPNFDTNGYVYIYYTYENDPANPQGPKNGRLIRVTANGDVAVPGSEVVLLGTQVGTPAAPSCNNFPTGTDCIPNDDPFHTGGGMEFAPDGKLFLAIGDSTDNFLDPNKLARVQNLDSLSGKVLRINTDGTGPADNPFFTGDPNANRSKIWAYGFRNPHSLTIQPGTNLPVVGNVGSTYWEEIDVATASGNYGWPCYEGVSQHPTNSSMQVCQELYASGAAVVHPVYSYERPPSQGAAVIGGVFYQGENYPSVFSNSFFFADWVQKKIGVLKLDANNELIEGSVETILQNQGSPIAFKIGPDGDVYYITWEAFTDSSGDIRHIIAPEGNLAPVAQASSSVQGGLSPLTVDFNNTSYDSDGNIVSYDWDFGDGSSSSQANPQHIFNQNGTYNVQLTVTDNDGATDTDVINIIVGNAPPEAFIGTPTARLSYNYLQTLTLNGSGFDPENGPMVASGLSWTVLLHHCEPVVGGGCHTHPYLQTLGTNKNFIAPADSGSELHFLEIRLTVTDNVGLKGTKSIFIGHNSDSDKVLDHEEILTLGTDPHDSDSDNNGVLDGEGDQDSDGLRDYQERFILKTNPNASDSNGNGTNDGLEDADGDGCKNVKELGPNKWLGGLRDPLNKWDFFDADHDSVIAVTDIGLIVSHYGARWGQPNYSINYDRSKFAGMSAWQWGPPDGIVGVQEIGAMVSAYGTDCR
ncbi:MAG: PQQ-dependent sugar dehydrogenase [Candidatus Woykebacteria bacterium]